MTGDVSEKAAGDASRAHRSNVLFADFLPTLIYTAGLYVAYTFINAQTGVTSYPYEINGSTDPQPVNSTLRLIICALAPVVIDMGCLGVCLAMACCAGPMLGLCCKRLVLLLLVLPMVLPSLFILFSLLLCGSLKVSILPD